jgi:hypothetical protein
MRLPEKAAAVVADFQIGTTVSIFRPCANGRMPFATRR